MCRQPSLSELWSEPTTGRNATLCVYDLFCGAGGFSEGARAAGHRVVLACDNNADALACHATNHPLCRHVLLDLPCSAHALEFPTDDTPFHIHASPPCQAFSTMNTRELKLEERRDGALGLVAWFLDLVMQVRPTSWSFEQVANAAVIKLLERERIAAPRHLMYAVVDFSELGVPQTRKRLLAGSPALLAGLLRKRDLTRRQCVLSVVPNPPIGATHLRSSARWIRKRRRHQRRPGEAKYTYEAAQLTDKLHPLASLAPTITTKLNAIQWVCATNACSVSYQCLCAADAAMLQTFSSSYQFPFDAHELSNRLVGNAYPPLVAKLLLE